MKNSINEWIVAVLKIIIAFVIVCVIGYLLTAGIYYLFTLIMTNFFNIIIPFSWTYALGVWLITILIRLLFGGVNAKQK